MRKRLFVIFLLITIISTIMNPFPVRAESGVDKNAIDQFVIGYMERNGLPGVSIVIVKDGVVLYEKGYGHDA